MISSMKPDIWASLADEVPSWVSDKRNKTSVDRTVKWLDECITLNSVRTLKIPFYTISCINLLSGFELCLMSNVSKCRSNVFVCFKLQHVARPMGRK